jgi:hypothetical protein
MDIQRWATAQLRPHREYTAIFGEAEESDGVEELLASIKAHGIWEPLLVRADGGILSGHLRHLCAVKLHMAEVPVRVCAPFASYLEEVTFVVRSNTDRRHCAPREVTAALSWLLSMAETKSSAPTPEPTHAERMVLSARAFRANYSALVGAYKETDRALSAMPLRSVAGPTEHDEYLALVRNLARRALREIEDVEGPVHLVAGTRLGAGG